MLSPLDWALIESWQEREVPLHIVLRGIESVFDRADKQPHRKRSVKSLFYCKEEIEAQFAEWLETQVGKNGGQSAVSGQPSEDESAVMESDELFSRSSVDEHLRDVSAALSAALEKAENAAIRETFERVLNRLEEIGAKYESAEKLEESLEKLDALIDETLLKTSDIEELQRETGKQMTSYKDKMDSEVFKRTLDLMIVKKLRETAGVPRLSLFYL